METCQINLLLTGIGCACVDLLRSVSQHPQRPPIQHFARKHTGCRHAGAHKVHVGD